MANHLSVHRKFGGTIALCTNKPEGDVTFIMKTIHWPLFLFVLAFYDSIPLILSIYNSVVLLPSAMSFRFRSPVKNIH